MNDSDFELPKMSDDGYWLLLLFLCQEREKEAERLIQGFENELVFQNRFSSNHVVIDELHRFAPYVTRDIKVGATFFRARVYHESGIDNIVKYCLRERGLSAGEIKEILSECNSTQKALLISPEVYSDDMSFPDEFEHKKDLIRTLKKWDRNTRFKGYDSKSSTAPSAEIVGEGRANPDHIRYLYLCEDVYTPIYEVRASIGDYVSVAKFRLQKDIRLYDLTKKCSQETSIEGSIPCLFDAISSLYSRPYKGKRENYIATQYIAEEIKNMGFDGLRFESSLHKGGYNIVLFNPDLCKAVCSDLVLIDDIEIQITPLRFSSPDHEQ